MGLERPIHRSTDKGIHLKKRKRQAQRPAVFSYSRSS
jgi:hypothetical protein